MVATGDPAGHVLDARASGSRAGGASFSLRVRVVRVLFGLVWALAASWTPPQARGWRRMLLRAFGARIASSANVYASAKIWYPPHLTMHGHTTLGPRVRCYNQAPIVLDEHAIVSQDASLCAGTHDHEDPAFQLVTRPIHIGAHAWIAAEAFVGPGVTVGDHAVLGARGVAMRNLDANTIYSGNPAARVRARHIRSD